MSAFSSSAIFSKQWIRAFSSILCGTCLLMAPAETRPSSLPQTDRTLVTEPSSSLASAEHKLFEPFTGKINGSRVRMRLDPSTESPIVREVDQNDLFLVTGEEGSFYLVAPPSHMKAYVFRTYVLDQKIEGSNVNVRLEPSRQGLAIAQLNTGDPAVGAISPQNSKWVEIAPPENTRFYIAKEYVDQAGGPDLLAKMERRQHEAQHLLNSAYLGAQGEMAKAFQEIDIERISAPFEKIILDYQDFPQYVSKAREILELVRDTYLQKKVAFLESKTMESSETWSVKNAELMEQIAAYEKKLSTFEAELDFESPRPAPVSASTTRAVSPAFSEPKSASLTLSTPEFTEELPREVLFQPLAQEAVAPLEETPPQTTLAKDKPPATSMLWEHPAESSPEENEGIHGQAFRGQELGAHFYENAGATFSAALTDKMRLWDPIEKAEYHRWLARNPGASLEDFYREESLDAQTISGIVEPYQRSVRNKPGDYLLKRGNRTVAYLYSTRVDLQDKVGAQVTLKVSSRPNHHFAFPAYHVLSAE